MSAFAIAPLVAGAGAILYEMLAGYAPFEAGTLAATADKILRADPPVLGGSPAIAAADRVIHRALAKTPAHRYQSASAMADDLRTVLDSRDDEPRRARAVTRFLVLPFRLLRADPEIDFLTFSLPDAISSALSGLPSLVVRSTSGAARFAGEAPDTAAIAAALDVDVVLLGTVLSNGDQVRVSAQLVDARSGTLVRAIAAQSPADDVFHLQDSLARSVVESLSLSLTASDAWRINRDAPASAEAYERYLRANQMQQDSTRWAAARATDSSAPLGEMVGPMVLVSRPTLHFRAGKSCRTNPRPGAALPRGTDVLR